MPTMRRDPALWLLVAILSVHAAIVFTHARHPLINDEIYYVEKARYLAEHRRFMPLDPHALAVERGREWGNSDWRPAGYPMLVAALSLGDFSDPAGALRLRVTLVQFLAVAASLLALYHRAVRAGIDGRARYIGAILLAAPPWIFGFVNEIGPDAAAVPFVVFGLLALGRNRFAAGTLLLSLTLFLRPEMIVLPPVIVAIALLLWRRGTFVRDAAVAAAIYLALVGAQVAYRTAFTGTPGIFGGLHIYNRGAFAWANDWLGTENETYDFVYALGERRVVHAPERAFDSAAERAAVERIVDRVAARRLYSAEDDAAFAKLAEEKQRQHPLRVVLLRGWHTVNPWINVELNGPLLNTMASVPRPLRLVCWGALFLLRIAALALAVVAFVRALRGDGDRLVLLMMAYAIARSLLVGVLLNWNVHRYILSAWPPVLWCACMALRRRP